MDPDQQYYENGKGGSNKKWWLIILIAILLVGGLAAVYVAHKNKKDKEAASTSTPSSQSTASTTPAFEPAVNSNQPYAATITTTVNGTPSKTTMISDGQGNYSYAYSVKGQNVTAIYTPTAYYVCNTATTCVKYPASKSSASGFDPTTFQYDTTKLENYKKSANYKGQQACPVGGGTCDVWEITSTSGGATTKLFVNTQTKKIARATYAVGSTQYNTDYEYKNVHITVPTNATTVPTP